MKNSPRGFVLLIVLAVAAVLAVVVAGQYVSAGVAQTTAIRGSEEVQARGIAEACLALATAYVNQYDQDAGPGDDFDDILAGPDRVPDNADDFLLLPAPTPVVLIPDSASGVGVPQLRLHQWNLIDIPGSNGVCAARIDDNSDDGRPDPNASPEVGENEDPTSHTAFSDVPNRDSDRSVFVTVLGLYPRLPGTADGDVYERAHARVTLRRSLQLPNVVQPLAPSLWAGDDISMDQDNTVCAKGGIHAVDALTMSSNSCGCGEIRAGNTSDKDITKAGTTCKGCKGVPSPSCIPASRPGGTPIGPPVSVHPSRVSAVLGAPFLEFMANESIGAPLLVAEVQVSGTAGGQGIDAYPAQSNSLSRAVLDPPALDVCTFYGTNDGKLFVWDGLDTDAKGTLETIGGALIPSLVAPVNCTLPAVAATDPLPRPCTWTLAGSSIGVCTPGGPENGQACTVPADCPASACVLPPGAAWTMTCGGGQSPCWKLLANLNGVAVDENVRLGSIAVGVPVGGIPEASDPGSLEEWFPSRNLALPNVANGRVFGNPANRLCGLANSCASCPAAPGGSDDALEWTGTEWELDSTTNNALMPVPAMFFFDADVDVDDVGGGGGPLDGMWRGSVISSGNIDVDNETNFCCARCNCTSIGSSTDIGTGGSCELDGVLGGSADAAVVNLKAANDLDTTTFDMDSRGFALRAVGQIRVNGGGGGAIDIVGDIRAGLIDVDEDDGCIIGNLVAYGNAGNCGGKKSCTGNSDLCLDNDTHIVGDVHSLQSISFDKGPKVYGNVVSKVNACFVDRAAIEGVVQAGADVQFDDDAIIANTTSSLGGAPTAANAALSTYLEATW